MDMARMQSAAHQHHSHTHARSVPLLRQIAMLRLAVRVRGLPSAAAAPLLRCMSSYPPHTVVGLPALSPTMKSGNIAKWVKKEGDSVKAGEMIAQVCAFSARFQMNIAGFRVMRGETSTTLCRLRRTRPPLTLSRRRTALSRKFSCQRAALTFLLAHPLP